MLDVYGNLPNMIWCVLQTVGVIQDGLKELDPNKEAPLGIPPLIELQELVVQLQSMLQLRERGNA